MTILEMRRLLLSMAFIGLGVTGVCSEATKNTTANIGVMTWFHPLLTPGLSEITLLCTVVGVEKGSKRYGNYYWQVRLRIDESIHVDKRYVKRLEGIQFITSGDFRRRKEGERIVFFAGGEPYEKDDFLKPCWSGTTTDLGNLLHAKDDLESAANDRLLASLRDQAKGGKENADSLQAFAEFSPKGVAHHLIMKVRKSEIAAEEHWEETKTPEVKTPIKER